MKKILITLLKFGTSACIIAGLCWKASSDKSFDQLAQQPKDWMLLGTATVVLLSAVLLTFFRWYLLVRALDVPLSLRDAIRFGFLGYLLMFVTVGVVGGDVLKSVFIAHQHPDRKTEAVASVVVDRMIGLYALLLVGSVSILSVPLGLLDLQNPQETWQKICIPLWITLAITGVSTLAIVMLIGSRRLNLSPWDALLERPRIGRWLAKPVAALRVYRQRVPLLLVAGLMSVANHVLCVVAVYLVARGLFRDIPSLGTHVMIVPMALLANTLPLPGGLGALEAALDLLYQAVLPAEAVGSQGFLVALGYRIITMAVAMIGGVYYLLGRREVARLIHEAEADPDLQVG